MAVFLAGRWFCVVGQVSAVLVGVALGTGCGGGAEAAPTGQIEAGAGGQRAKIFSATAQSAAAVAAAAPGKPQVIVVRAGGGTIDGVGAHAALLYKGVVLAAGELVSAELLDYRIEVPMSIDGGVLDIVLYNALNANSQPARQLQIESVSLAGVVFKPGDAMASFDQGDGDGAFDGKNVSAGRSTLTSNGALRFQMPSAGELAAGSTGGGSAATPPPPGYYVDATLGNDNNAGTIASPWRTLSRLSAVRLKVGEGLYLRCGRLWRESLTLGALQLVDGSTLAGYGADCTSQKAAISGADDFSGGWSLSDGVWSRAVPAGTPKITQLFINGQAMQTAQWPNVSTAGRGVALAAAPSAAGALTDRSVALLVNDAARLSGRDLNGATLQLRTQPWLIETLPVSDSSAGLLQLGRATAWTVQQGQGYVLQDKLWMLDSPGEFFHDSTAQRVYLMAPTNDVPADLNAAFVEGSVRDTALLLSDRSGLVVRDLSLQAARAEGVRAVNAPAAVLLRIEARDNADAGVRLRQLVTVAGGEAASTVSDGLVTGNGRYGIDAADVHGAIVARNRVLGTGIGANRQGGVIASIAVGAGGRVEDNVVEGSGYIGISFSPRADAVILRNTVSGHCMRLTDCAGIYTWSARDRVEPGQQSTVQGNTVSGGEAALEGTSTTANLVAGIYVDDFSNGVTVTDNLLVNTPAGVFVHNASGVKVLGNRIWLPSQVALWASMDQRDGDWMTGNSFKDNQIVPLVVATATAGGLPSFTTSQAVWFTHSIAGEAALAPSRNQFSGNTVVQLQGPLMAHAWLRGPGGERFVDSSEWQTLNHGEPKPLRPVRYTPLLVSLGAELVVDSGLDSGLNGWLTWQSPSSTAFSVKTLVNQTGCDGGCISFTAGNAGDLLSSRPFNLRAGVPHLYRWTASMPANAGASVGMSYISRDTTPWDSMSDARGFISYGPRRAAAGELLGYEAFFVAKSSDPARVNVQLDTPNVAVTFDAVSVREVTGYSVARVADWAVVASTAAGAPRTFTCADLGWPAGCSAVALDGQPVSMPMPLAAGQTRLVLRADSPFKR